MFQRCASRGGEKGMRDEDRLHVFVLYSSLIPHYFHKECLCRDQANKMSRLLLPEFR